GRSLAISIAIRQVVWRDRALSSRSLLLMVMNRSRTSLPAIASVAAPHARSTPDTNSLLRDRAKISTEVAARETHAPREYDSRMAWISIGMTSRNAHRNQCRI